MTTANGPDASLNSASDATTQITPADNTRRVCLFLALGGVVAALIAVVIMLVADSDIIITWRSLEMGTWAPLVPAIFAILTGAYGYLTPKAYNSAGAAKAFIGVGLVFAFIFIRMALVIFS